MSSQIDPAHNLDALLIGTGEFNFSQGALSAADARARGFLDFGNIVAFTPEVNATKQEHVGSYRGIRRIDKTVVTETKIIYKLQCDEWNLQNLRILFGATDTAGHAQTILSAATGQPWAFNTTPAVIGKWYDILKADGTRLRDLTSVTIATLVEGTDFVLDLKLGRIKFLTAQSISLTATITCPAIVAGNEGSFFGLLPGQAPVQSGYGNIIVYDQHSLNKVG